jgi:hypothetical protein
MNKKGQSVLAEHAMIFFIVIGALVAMTIFVRRGFEAKIHDARNFMINSVMNSSVCDANCVAATGGGIYYEYEPYYVQSFSNVLQSDNEFKGLTNGNAAETGSIYINTVNDQSNSVFIGGQLPPECAPVGNAAVPAYCAGL